MTYLNNVAFNASVSDVFDINGNRINPEILRALREMQRAPCPKALRTIEPAARARIDRIKELLK